MTAHFWLHQVLLLPFLAGSRLAHTGLVIFLRRHRPRRRHDRPRPVPMPRVDLLWPLADTRGPSIVGITLGQCLATLGLDCINSRLVKRFAEALCVLFACLVDGGSQ